MEITGLPAALPGALTGLVTYGCVSYYIKYDG